MRGCPHSVECGIEAALQGPLGVADIDRLRCKAWMKRTGLVASAVSRARLRGYAELEHGVAPVNNVRGGSAWRSFPLRGLVAAQVIEPQQMRDTSPGELGRRGGTEASVPEEKIRIGPSWGSAAGNPKAAGLVRRCTRRHLPLKLCRARAEDPCGEGGSPTIRLRQSNPVEKLRHPNRCDAAIESKDRTFRSASPSRSEACLRRRMPRARQVCKRRSSQDKHCCQHSAERTSTVIRGRLWKLSTRQHRIV
jgi:hypothetical protein